MRKEREKEIRHKMENNPSLMEKDPLLKELGLLRGLLRMMHNDVALEETLGQALRLSRDILPFDCAFIYFVDGEGHDLVLRATSNIYPHAVGQVALRMGEGVTGWVAREMSPVIISEKAWMDPRFKMFQIFEEEQYEAFLSDRKSVV